jgi:hypothetical protein
LNVGTNVGSEIGLKVEVDFDDGASVGNSDET